MTIKTSEWVHHRVSLSPRTDANMKALARRIGGDQGIVFDNSLDLYSRVNLYSRVKEIFLAQGGGTQGGGTLYVEDAQGNRTQIDVR
ncbi:MAG: hypothetical protein TE42_08645 [Candidatus Synechococcus spongiarum SP3]|uniref:Uncharacterized protein n=1 Tax=Candidatus Synechococcus spongiarum SP3 TaxID=1604020 RepID=A0A0G2IVR0_9SYNE|nr:MAG: hypothetical protein TE42_08645 [Candidatus Synechococcus spongiarum SP3]